MDGFIQREGSSPSTATDPCRRRLARIKPATRLVKLHVESRKRPVSTTHNRAMDGEMTILNKTKPPFQQRQEFVDPPQAPFPEVINIGKDALAWLQGIPRPPHRKTHTQRIRTSTLERGSQRHARHLP